MCLADSHSVCALATSVAKCQHGVNSGLYAVGNCPAMLCLLQESEYAAWTLVNGYSLNHAAVSVHRLQDFK